MTIHMISLKNIKKKIRMLSATVLLNARIKVPN